MPPKVVHGARAKVFITDRVTGKTKLVGIWNNFSYQVNYDVQPSFILGRFSAAELTTTGVEPVNITAQGFRVIDHGAFEEGRLTNVKDLLTQEYLKLDVLDRQTNKKMASIEHCLPTGTSSTLTAKQLTEQTNTYLGLLMDDESTQNAEAASAADLP
jgi:hypothetical protein